MRGQIAAKEARQLRAHGVGDGGKIDGLVEHLCVGAGQIGLERGDLLLLRVSLGALLLENPAQQRLRIAGEQSLDVRQADAQLAVCLNLVQETYVLLRVVPVPVFAARDGGQKALFLIEFDGALGAAHRFGSLCNPHGKPSCLLVSSGHAQYTPIRCVQVNTPVEKS